jgi:branched-chain amino acid transport system substrate-binding protein
MAAKADGFIGVDRYIPVLEGQFKTPYHKKFMDDSVARLQPFGVSLPDRYVQSNYEGVNFLKLGMERSKFRGREDTMKLIEALEGMEVKESDDFPQGDKTLRKEDHQAFVREFIFEVRDQKYKILDIVPKEKTVVPPACKFA